MLTRQYRSRSGGKCSINKTMRVYIFPNQRDEQIAACHRAGVNTDIAKRKLRVSAEQPSAGCFHDIFYSDMFHLILSLF
jgi:hypothetical protein